MRFCVPFWAKRPARAPLGLWAVLLCALSLGTGTAVAATPPFVWADADGTVHESMRLTDVPEPFLAIYRARAVARGNNSGAAAQVATGPEAERAAWQRRLQMARENLMTATVQWADLSRRDAELKLNPVLRLTPAYQAQIEAGAKPLAAALARYLAARKALTETLPEAARKAGVPMAWLQ